MTILVRVELDIVGVKPTANIRFKKTAEAVAKLAKANNKLVLIGHRGRPNGKRVPSLTFKPFAAALAKHTGKKVIFIPHFDFQKIRRQLKAAPNGSVFLLENIRFLPGEEKNSKVLARELASLGDSYINDDFATSHRTHASLVALPELLPATMGPNLRAELKALDRVSKEPRKPLILVIGGAKTKDKLGIVNRLLPKTDFVLLGGGPANTLLKARGVRIGKSLYDRDVIKTLGPLAKNQKIVTPLDCTIAGEAILDIGPVTVKEYTATLRGANTIIWNGPMGVFERKAFATGTEAIAKAILANKKAFRLIGGGDTASALTKLNLTSRFERSGAHLSAGGGAMLTYLAGEKLPALEVLRK